MPPLNSARRREVWAEWMRKNLEEITINKNDLRAALDAIDTWVNTNKTSFNAAIPLPARTSLSADQKARLLLMVVEERFIQGA